jgi:uncharacterized protein
MYRKINDYLLNWKKSPIRVPLIVRGARQVGKSYSIREFGSSAFQSLVEINLETQPHLIKCFESFSASKICSQLEVICNVDIRPGKTLLFIDEIQASREALMSLRSFKEDLPDLHVIAAGSLLEFALQDPGALSFPVGRVSFAYLHPLSFKEFLLAIGEEKLHNSIEAATLEDPCSTAVHDRLIEMLRLYYMVGGMPEAIKAYTLSQSILEARRVHSRLVTAFVADFAKYGRRYDYRRLQQLLKAVPRLVGKKFKYSHVDSDVNARDFKLPLLDLERSGIVRLVRASSANGVPLGSEERSGVFKVQYLDIGLMISALGMDLYADNLEDFLFANEGSLAEQYVGQQILAAKDHEVPPQLYYWVREVKGSAAEIDYVDALGSKVIPIEVKAGSTGTLKSLHQFMVEKKSEVGIRISQHPLSKVDRLISVPLYMVAEIPRLILKR